MTRADRGAASELLVCVDLMEEGYEVFRNMSPNGPVDVVALKDGKYWGVQVKSAGASVPDSPGRKGWHVLAICTRDGGVRYRNSAHSTEPFPLATDTLLPLGRCRYEWGLGRKCRNRVAGNGYCAEHAHLKKAKTAAQPNADAIAEPSPTEATTA